MKQIFQNNFQQHWVCTLIKHHTVLFMFNFNSTSDRALGCFHMLRQFLPHYDQVRVEPFTKQHIRTHDLGTRTIGVSGTNNPFILSGPCRNLFCGRGINHFGLCRGRTPLRHRPNKAEIAGMGAGRKASRLEALCSHIVLTLHPNTL